MTDPLLQSRETTAVNRGLIPLAPPNFTGLKLAEDIILNDFTLNRIDSNGVVWVVQDIEGWWNLPESQVRDIPRGWADGSYDVTGKWLPRNMTLKGSFLPPDPSLVSAARMELLNASALVYDGGWLRVYEEPQKACFVRLSGRPQIQTVNARGRTDFSIGLRAANPIKYGWNDFLPDGYLLSTIPCKSVSPAQTGILNLPNEGNWDTTMVIEIDGPIIGPATIENQTTGELILIIAPVDAPSTLTIDTYRQEVDLDGDRDGARAMLDVLTNWMVLAPGDNSIKFEDIGSANSTAVMRVYYRPAFIG
jgi:Phage tail protein